MTFPERLLWGRLRSGRCLGLKWRRQHVIGAYVADFYCAAARLVVEVDGMSHVGRGPIDAKRDAFIREQGYRVVRVTNDDVLGDVDAVVDYLADAAMATIPSPGPSLKGRGVQGEAFPLAGSGSRRSPASGDRGSDKPLPLAGGGWEGVAAPRKDDSQRIGRLSASGPHPGPLPAGEGVQPC